MKQTAVEWLVDELEKHHVVYNIKNTNAYQIAKQMELAQHIENYNQGHIDRNNNIFKLPKLKQNEKNV